MPTSEGTGTVMKKNEIFDGSRQTRLDLMVCRTTVRVQPHQIAIFAETRIGHRISSAGTRDPMVEKYFLSHT